VSGRMSSAWLARVYFAAQALGGVVWWVAVATSPFVRVSTLGGLDPVAVAVADIPLFVVASAVAALGVRPAAWLATAWTMLVAIALAAYATLTGEAGWGVILMAAAAGASLAALSLLVRGRLPNEWLIAGPFAFHPATRRGGGARYVLATAKQIVVFWGLSLAVVPVVLALLERRWGVDVAFPGAVAAAGAGILALASLLGLWSAHTMSTLGEGTPLPSAMPNALVVAGPYRFVRNPMAVAGIVQGAAVGLLLSSWVVVAYAVAGSLLWNFAIRPLEEADLEVRFGEPYRRYRDAVRCWIPRFTPRADA
jgi:protein-S-isoprenylcysteine O-methyltransferase Ste14